MGIFDRLFGSPQYEWLAGVPQPMRPSPAQSKALEDLRREYNIPPGALAVRIVVSAVTTRKVEAAAVAALRQQRPAASDADIWEAALARRAAQAPPDGWGWDAARIRAAAERIGSFDDLVSFVLKTDDQMEPPPSDPLGFGRRVDEILSS
jgi:hypothetical protein